MKIYSYLILILVVFFNKTNASDICRVLDKSDLLIYNQPKYLCRMDWYENEVLDLNELAIAGGKLDGSSIGNIYKDKANNTWFIKRTDVFREYVGGHILRLFLGDDRIAEVKPIKEEPLLVASKKLENFKPLKTLIGNNAYYDWKKMPTISNKEDILVGMNYIGLGDQNTGNQGYIEKNGKREASRVDYDFSFNFEAFYNSELFNAYIDYGKLEEAIIRLINLPEDQLHRILEVGEHLKFFAQSEGLCQASSIKWSRFISEGAMSSYLGERKRNFQQLLPLITCLKKVLNEGDMNYLKENKDILISFQNTVEPDSQITYLNILMHQLVERGCIEALKKLKELELHEYKKGYGFRSEDLMVTAYQANQNEMVDYLLKDDKVPLLKTLMAAFNDGNRNIAGKLSAAAMFRPEVGISAALLSQDALEWAIRSNDLAMVKKLVDAGSDVEEEFVLDFALEVKCSVEMFDYLLEKGARKTLKEESGRYFIHRVAKAQRSDVVELLVRYGIDPHSCDEDGKTAYDYLGHKVDF